MGKDESSSSEEETTTSSSGSEDTTSSESGSGSESTDSGSGTTESSSGSGSDSGSDSSSASASASSSSSSEEPEPEPKKAKASKGSKSSKAAAASKASKGKSGSSSSSKKAVASPKRGRKAAKAEASDSDSDSDSSSSSSSDDGDDDGEDYSDVLGRASVAYAENERPNLGDESRESSARMSLDVPRLFEENRQAERRRLAADKKAKKGKKGKGAGVVGETRQVTYHTKSIDELQKEFKTRIDAKDGRKSQGLRVKDIEALQAKYGKNELPAKKPTPLIIRLGKEFVGFFPLLLELAGIMCLIAYALEKSQNPDATDDNLYLGIILILVVIATALFSFAQEAKSAAMMAGFADLNPDKCRVRRDGVEVQVEAAELVPGDIVILDGGDRTPADVVVLWASNMKVDNSSLTGENEPQARRPGMTDESYLETKNLAFSSTLVSDGNGVGVVYATGANTEIGHIAHLAGDTKQEPTPLNKEVSMFIKIVSAVAISFGVIFFVVALFLEVNPVLAAVFGISVIVANVPEGLLPTLTVALTLTAKKLSRKNVLVKNLESVETLGSCSTICSDKTGTLTLNQMTVVACYYDSKTWFADRSVDGGVSPVEHGTYRALRQVCALNNRSDFNRIQEGNMDLPPLERAAAGNASEIAMLRMCAFDEGDDSFGDINVYRAAHDKIFEIPFNSDNKWQLSIHQIPHVSGLALGTAAEDEEGYYSVKSIGAFLKKATGKKSKKSKDDGVTRIDSRGGEYLLTLKGAPERVLAFCTHIMDQGQVRPLKDSDHKKFQRAYQKMAASGRRVLAMSRLHMTASSHPDCFKKKFEFTEENFPRKGYTFLGLTGLMDPPRPEVPDAIADCATAGIQVIMVTGDHPLTAEAISRSIGIIKKDSLTVEQAAEKLKIKPAKVTIEQAPAVVIKGSDIPDLTEDDWESILERKEVVFARTSPEQKLQIVEQCQLRGRIVAVTGDGVNDSPALRKSNLGCAMGITGTAVAQDAADIILLDDNFASIVTGVRQGRIIFDNLKKSITYTLSSNFAELLPFIFFIVAQLPLALTAVLILCIDLGTDMVPAISLAYEKPEADIMRRQPRNPAKDRLVTIKLAIFAYLWLGFIQATAGFLGYFLAMGNCGFEAGEIFGTAVNNFNTKADLWDNYVLPPRGDCLALDAYLDRENIDRSEITTLQDSLAGTNQTTLGIGNSTFFGDADKGSQSGIVISSDSISLGAEPQVYILREAQTAFFVGVVVTRMGCSLLVKTRKRSVFGHGIFGNPYLDGGLAFEAVLAVALTYVPFLNIVFTTAPIQWWYWFMFLPFTLFVIGADEVRKLIIRRFPGTAFAKIIFW